MDEEVINPLSTSADNVSQYSQSLPESNIHVQLHSLEGSKTSSTIKSPSFSSLSSIPGMCMNSCYMHVCV